MNRNPLKLRAASFTAFVCLFIFSSIAYMSCKNKDKCEGVVCYDGGGTCVDGKCACLTGFSGTVCDIPDAKKFVGLYSGHNPCNNADTFKIDSSYNNQVFIKIKVGSDTCAKNILLTGTAIGDTVRFPAQGFLDHCQASYAFSADGFIRNDSLIMTLRYNFPFEKDTCVFGGVK